MYIILRARKASSKVACVLLLLCFSSQPAFTPSCGRTGQIARSLGQRSFLQTKSTRKIPVRRRRRKAHAQLGDSITKLCTSRRWILSATYARLGNLAVEAHTRKGNNWNAKFAVPANFNLIQAKQTVRLAKAAHSASIMATALVMCATLAPQANFQINWAQRFVLHARRACFKNIRRRLRAKRAQLAITK